MVVQLNYGETIDLFVEAKLTYLLKKPRENIAIDNLGNGSVKILRNSLELAVIRLLC